MDTREFVRDLRAIADWYETHADLAAPAVDMLNVFLTTKAELQHAARALGECTKDGDDNWFWVARRFGGIRLEFNVPRAVACVRRVVGMEDVPERVTPAHRREIVAWDCEPILEAMIGTEAYHE